MTCQGYTDDMGVFVADNGKQFGAPHFRHSHIRDNYLKAMILKKGERFLRV